MYKTSTINYSTEQAGEKTDELIPHGMVKPLYSSEVNPDNDVRAAINLIEEKLRKKMRLPDFPQEPRVVFLKELQPSKENYILLQQWEGSVLEVKSDYFVCHLRDMKYDSPDETAEVPLNEISDNDLHLVSPGGFFYWNIGYYVNKSGQRTRSSMIRFRRLPAWTKHELESAKIRAYELSRKLKWGLDASDSRKEKAG